MSTTDDAARIVASIGREARRRRVPAYLVGGALRDRLRRRVPRDVDVAIEGDAASFARGWARRSGAEVVATPDFGTASVRTGTGARSRRVDFASTRGERYRHPGALPEVFPAGIETDLARRDFTINAMAMPLSGPRAGALIDPYGGREDLRRGIVRMLHPGSPHDDPTRALRAVRLARRLGFRVEPRTRRWIAEAAAAGAFARVSGDRWRRELSLLWAEQPPVAGAAALARLGIDRAIDPALALHAGDRRRLASLDLRTSGVDPEARAFAVLLTWILDRSDEDRRRVADRLGYAGARRAEILRIGADRAVVAKLRSERAPLSAFAAAARAWSPEEAAAIEAGSAPRTGAAIRRARGKGAALRLRIRGADLVRSGLPAGPGIGRALERTWRARLDGRISASEELAFALEAALQ